MSSPTSASPWIEPLLRSSVCLEHQATLAARAQRVVTDRERHAVAQVATDASCIDARSILVSTAAVIAHQNSSSDMASHGRQQAGTAYPPLRCHSRLGCTEAMSAAISSPFTSLASHCIWCTRRTRLVPRIRSLALRASANRPRIRTEATDADATIFVAIGAYSGGSRTCSWFSRSLSPSALVIAEWPASKPEPLRCARQRHLPCSSCQSTAWQAQPASTATADWRVPRP